MKKLALGLLFLLMVAARPALANPDALVGTWRLVSCKAGDKRVPVPAGFSLLLSFDKAAHSWTADMAHQGAKDKAAGSWSMERNVLTMEYKGTKTQMLVASAGDTLTLAPVDKPTERLVVMRTAKPKE